MEPTLIDSSMSRHLPSHHVLGSEDFQLFLQLSVCQAVAKFEAWTKMLRQWVFGSDGDPTPRGVGFRLSQELLCHSIMLPSPSVWTRVGSVEAGSLSVDWCSWENIRRGIHGSTSEHRDGLYAVVPVSHEYLGATASDLGSVGECAN